MTRPISEDLRRRILEVREESGKTYEELAEQFRVGRATVNRVLRLKRETGDVQPRPRGGGMPRRVSDEELPRVKRLVDAHPDATLTELAVLVSKALGRSVIRPTLGRMMVRLPWAPVGKRVVGHVPRNRGTVLTMIGALTLDGVEALMTVEGGTSGAVFLSFVNDYLVPTLRQGDLVVVDNLGAHHATGVKETIRAAGADVLYLPPYSPDHNPIELCWSKSRHCSGSWRPAPSAHS